MSEQVPALVLKCPVCGARFRGSASCSRCGTDLTPLMRLASKAWLLRRAAQAAAESGNLSQASRLSAAARRLQKAAPA